MKKKTLKIIALILALVLIALIGWFANGLVGNPVSKYLAEKSAEKYVAENYAGTDYYIETLAFNFKFSNYYAHIRSDSSMDTQFTLYITMLGEVYFDTYEDVLSGAITARRVEDEYRELTDQIFDSPAFPYETDIAFGTLMINPGEAVENPDATDIPDYTLLYEDLELDKIYDPRELGAQAGHLVVYVYSEELTYEIAAEVLLGIRAEFDKANVPFRAIDLTLQHPREEDQPRDEDYIGTSHFLYEDIDQEGLAERVQKADEALKAHYAEMDAQKKAEIQAAMENEK